MSTSFLKRAPNGLKSNVPAIVEDVIAEEPSSNNVTINEFQSGLPPLEKAADPVIIHYSKQTETNPFRIPTDDEIFAMRETERRNRQAAREKNKDLKIYEKTSAKMKDFRRILGQDQEEADFAEQLEKEKAQKFDLRGNIRANISARENLTDFMTKKREMFFLQYTLDVKKAEILKLEEIAKAEEHRLMEDEKALEADAAKFDAFLKENDRNSVEAIKKAEAETKGKLEKLQEIKKMNLQITAIRSEMSKNEDLLRDYKRYKEFLDKLTPPEWLAQHRSVKSKSAGRPVGKPHKKAVAAAEGDEKETESGEDDIEDSDDDDGEMYFQNPQQLMTIFAELEENNLVLIQTCQETEETLEELKKNISDTESRMQNETQTLRQQIDALNTAIHKEEEKAAILEEKTRMFSVGLGDAEYQERILIDLDSRVKEAYKKCIGDSEADLNTIQMLTSIENKLESLLEIIEGMPSDLVEQAEKMKDKERRQRLREDKLEQQRILQDERIKKALERAKAAPVRVVKKPAKALLFRSQINSKKSKKKTEIKTNEDEDLAYFFKDD